MTRSDHYKPTEKKMLKPLLGAAAVLLVMIALLAGNLNSDFSKSAEPVQVAEVEKPKDKLRPNQVFSRQAPDPLEAPDPGFVEDEIYYDEQDGEDPFAVPEGTNDPFASSPFIDPNSGFAGEDFQEDKKPATASAPVSPRKGRADGVIRPGPLPDRSGPQNPSLATQDVISR
ncbi:hypothetical protein ACR9YC_05525 [Parasphingorhabdus sp. DH2-15]|uniref:hypothetical protein n=1 Tax=Parasphingorhabdus sp. DH2-15 TaxID=3444112 RepID=UPI003F684A3C